MMFERTRRLNERKRIDDVNAEDEECEKMNDVFGTDLNCKPIRSLSHATTREDVSRGSCCTDVPDPGPSSPAPAVRKSALGGSASIN